METWFYQVVSIDGDYANLKRTDIDSTEPSFQRKYTRAVSLNTSLCSMR